MQVKFLSKCQPVPCVEDDDFVAEFNRMVAENTQVTLVQYFNSIFLYCDCICG